MGHQSSAAILAPPVSLRPIYEPLTTTTTVYTVSYTLYMLNCKINGTVHIFFLKKSYLSPRCPKLTDFFSQLKFSHNIYM